MEAETPIGQDESLDLSSQELDSIAESSRPYIGTWHALVSRTNWEKGKIIVQWRRGLEAQGVSVRLYSDPAWSRLVGEVTAQHVGRLRRTWQRFGDVHDDYEGLYWSHFYAALDWDDAEMWLEGAVQNRWSVSQMRYQRWETRGKLKEEKPSAGEVVADREEEGVAAVETSSTSGETRYSEDAQSIQGPLREGPDFGEEPEDQAEPATPSSSKSGDRIDLESVLSELPADIVKPFRQLRQALLNAKADDWQTAKRIHLVALVNDLRQVLRNEPKTEPGAARGS